MSVAQVASRVSGCTSLRVIQKFSFRHKSMARRSSSKSKPGTGVIVHTAIYKKKTRLSIAFWKGDKTESSLASRLPQITWKNHGNPLLGSWPRDSWFYVVEQSRGHKSNTSLGPFKFLPVDADLGIYRMTTWNATRSAQSWVAVPPASVCWVSQVVNSW